MIGLCTASVLAFLLPLFHDTFVDGATLRTTRAREPPIDASIIANASSASIQLLQRDITPGERQRLDILSEAWRGIYWEYAYPGASDFSTKFGCTVDNFNILVEATRMAIELASYNAPDGLREDPWSNRFFVRNSVAPEGGRWTSRHFYTAYGNMQHNLFQPSRFPRTGKGPATQRYRVTYQCKDTEPPPPGGGCSGDAPAYTAQADFTGTGVTTVFCPKFFTSGRYLNEIMAGPRKTINDFGDPSLVSYEQMMIHEWMHADIMGFQGHITDVVDSLSMFDPNNKVKIYGMSRCRDYAWKWMFRDEPECSMVNRATVWNADNYAWYFANKYYARAWGWIDDGSNWGLAITGNSTGSACNNPAFVNASAEIDVTRWPTQCSPIPEPDAINVNITCVYDGAPPLPIGGESLTLGPSINPTPSPFRGTATVAVATSTVTVLWSAPTCNCTEDGCSSDSPACCANGTCGCTCDEKGCKGLPCCASGTCR